MSEGEDGSNVGDRPFATVEQLREVEAACSHDYLLATTESRPSTTSNSEVTTAYLVCRFCLRQARVGISR